jgi:uncharacterized repeat protein (TIGR03803 family)
MTFFRSIASLLTVTLTLCAARGQATLTSVASFGSNNGAYPFAGLIAAADGNFYGTTQLGGAHNQGTVFRLTPGGTLVAIASFDGTNGSAPRAGLAMIATDPGALFGTTFFGGSSNYGTAFRCPTNGGLTTLVSFLGTNGAKPQASLVAGPDGLLRGTTYQGGTNDWPLGYGTTYQLTTSGLLTTTESFDNANGAQPWASLVAGPAGDYYGTTQVGGTNGSGTVYRLSAAGDITTLASFNGANGSLPVARLLADGAGLFYGTTSGGGVSDLGTVFQVSTNGGLATLASFGGANGAVPLGGLVWGGDGQLYGTTSQGGTGGRGTVYRITTNGSLTTLAHFNGLNGEAPRGELTSDGAGNYYGTTEYGGANDLGTVFKLTLATPAAPPVFVSITSSGNVISLSWSASVGRNYRLQYDTNLVPVAWLNLGGIIPATNSVMTAVDVAPADTQRFYRAVLLP